MNNKESTYTEDVGPSNGKPRLTFFNSYSCFLDFDRLEECQRQVMDSLWECLHEPELDPANFAKLSGHVEQIHSEITIIKRQVNERLGVE